MNSRGKPSRAKYSIKSRHDARRYLRYKRPDKLERLVLLRAGDAGARSGLIAKLRRDFDDWILDLDKLLSVREPPKIPRLGSRVLDPAAALHLRSFRRTTSELLLVFAQLRKLVRHAQRLLHSRGTPRWPKASTNVPLMMGAYAILAAAAAKKPEPSPTEMMILEVCLGIGEPTAKSATRLDTWSKRMTQARKLGADMQALAMRHHHVGPKAGTASKS
jgi:hypothetical protein